MYYRGYIAAMIKFAVDISYAPRQSYETDKMKEIKSKDLTSTTWDIFNSKEKGNGEESMYGTV